MAIEWIVDGKLRCTTCNEYKEFSEYHKDTTRKNIGLAYRCKTCAGREGAKHHARRMKHDDGYKRAMKNRYIKGSFGISVDEYESRLVRQNHCCALCGSTTPKGGWHLDHNHTTGEIREFLCNVCNRGLGYFQDDPAILLKAIAYLEKHGTATGVPKEGSGQ